MKPQRTRRNTEGCFSNDFIVDKVFQIMTKKQQKPNMKLSENIKYYFITENSINKVKMKHYMKSPPCPTIPTSTQPGSKPCKDKKIQSHRTHGNNLKRCLGL